MKRPLVPVFVFGGALLVGCAGSSIIQRPEGDGGADATLDTSSTDGTVTDRAPTDGPSPDIARADGARADGPAVVPEAGAPSSPCMGVPTAGECMSPMTLRYCEVDTFSQTPDVLRTFTCPAGTQCMVNSGRAACVPTTTCREGASVCADANTIARCAGGMVSTSPCADGCRDTGLGAATCLSSVPRATDTRTFTIVYEVRPITPDYGGWRDPIIAAAQDFDVLLMRGNDVLDVARTQLVPMAGQVQFRLPTTPTMTDRIVVFPVKFKASGEPAYALMKPGFPAPTPPMVANVQATGAPRPSPSLWAWEFPVMSLPADGVLRITEASGSGAAHLFNMVGEYSRALSMTYGGATPLPFVVWFEYGTDWDCGICVSPDPVTVTLGGLTFPFIEQGYIPGGTVNRRYFADGVLGHEWGHWIMESYGRSPGEGGPHGVGIPSFPGLAWSEGWATWLSSDQRQSPIYYDVQGDGIAFYFDLSQRLYRVPSVVDGGVTTDAAAPSRPEWFRPFARQSDGTAAPVLQFHDENDVSAILYDLADGGMSNQLYRALAAPRMTQTTMINGQALFERGYTRRQWSGSAPPYMDVVNTGIAAPFLADFLDALNCAGYPRDRIDRATVPMTFYPYPSSTPLCR